MRVGAYLKTRHWERYQAREGIFENGATKYPVKINLTAGSWIET